MRLIQMQLTSVPGETKKNEVTVLLLFSSRLFAVGPGCSKKIGYPSSRLTHYLLVEDRLRQVFRVDLDVLPWCGDIEHDNPVSWDAADPMARSIDKEIGHAAYIEPLLRPVGHIFGQKVHIVGKFGTFRIVPHQTQQNTILRINDSYTPVQILPSFSKG